MTRRCHPVTSFVTTLLLWLSIAGTAFAADPLARAALQTKGTIYVGQNVLVDVDVLVPNYFLEPPQFPQFDLPGAVVTIQDGKALNLNETIGDTDYSGIRRTYVITPQRAGAFSLPPAKITFGYAAEPGKTTPGTVTIPALRFDVAAPGDNQGTSDVVAAKVAVTQDLDRDPATLKAGDTLVRTINVRAEGLRAMLIPEPDLTAPSGIRVYRRDPSLGEEKNESSEPVAGTRRDVASYVFSEPGTYVLPAVELSWFDPATAATEVASVPAVTVKVAVAEAQTSAIPPPAPPQRRQPYDWYQIALISAAAIGAALVLWAIAIALTRLAHWWSARQAERRQSEAAFFRNAERALGADSGRAFTQALDAWTRKAGVAPLESWIRQFADAETRKAYEAHQRQLYGAPEKISAQSSSNKLLLVGLRKARHAWLANDSVQAQFGKSGLPPLNP